MWNPAAVLRWPVLVLFAALLGWHQPPPTPDHPKAATVVSDPAGFTFSVPGDFAASPEVVAAAPIPLLYAFKRQNGDREAATFVIFEQMKGVIGRERPDAKLMPPGSAARMFKARWKGFEIDAFEVPESANGVQLLTFNAQVPIKPRALQVTVFGPAARKTELLQLLSSTLNGLDGPTNWIGSILPASISGAEGYGTILGVTTLVLGLLGLVVLWLLSRRTPRGTVFVIAAFLYTVTLLIPHSSIREVLMLSGGLRLFSVVAGLLGIVDLCRVRGRRPNPPAASAPR